VRSFLGVEKQWTLFSWIANHVVLQPPVCKEKKWENVGYVLHYLNDYSYMLYVAMSAVRGS